MRFRSKEVKGYQIFAVSGVNTVSFGISASAQARRGLLGFAVERYDPTEKQKYTMPGYKVFPSIIPNPDESTRVSTWDHPVQSFVWDDFTAKPDRTYEYFFHPLKGKPRNLDRSTEPIRITVKTEPLFSKEEHDIFFNRGVASSQAYAKRFGNMKPDELPDDKKEEALKWLARDLEEAILRFIRQAKPKDTLLCCFYEFRYKSVLDALKTAIDNKVDVRIIVDAKDNAFTDKKGKHHDSFPWTENENAIHKAKIPMKCVFKRTARPHNIQHNKFMVLLDGSKQDHRDPQAWEKKPATQVWTGSTNISCGGIFGQTNVGHWVRNKKVAQLYKEYWKLLSENLGVEEGDERSTARSKNATYSKRVEGLVSVPAGMKMISEGITPVFSPRRGLQILKLYFSLVDSPPRCSCITLAFGINQELRDLLVKHTPKSNIVFMLLEKEDKRNPRSKKQFVPINASHNVYKAWGSFLKDPVYQFAKETNTRKLQMNQHVSYVHSKFLLMDPLGEAPIVVTGSANFSAASTNANDENMLIISGDQRVADIYFSEFNRLFGHYYFRAVAEATQRFDMAPERGSQFLSETDDWLKKYAPGTYRSKRLQVFLQMKGF
jgi:phosphatidylserine/phosphatidylglycerophosphate/cardiolipin synthase-like enzyme